MTNDMQRQTPGERLSKAIAKLEKVAAWLEKNAAIQEEAAARHIDFPGLVAEELATAKIYRNTAADIRRTIEEVRLP